MSNIDLGQASLTTTIDLRNGRLKPPLPERANNDSPSPSSPPIKGGEGIVSSLKIN